MNTSFYGLCRLLCWPPCPAEIGSKIALVPPPPSYFLRKCESGSDYSLHLDEQITWQLPADKLDSIEAFYTKTSRGNRIICMFVKCLPDAKYTIFTSHGNAEDCGQLINFYLDLGSSVDCNVFSYDYSGYGQSEGRPTEKNMYADVHAAWHALQESYGLQPENVILHGRSIGTVPTIDLASKCKVSGVILQSPLTSGIRLLFPQTKRTWFFDCFPNIEKVGMITAPVLVIHGTNDQVIDISHGKTLYELCQRPVEPLWLKGAGHNNVDLFDEYTDRLRKFINEELST